MSPLIEKPSLPRQVSSTTTAHLKIEKSEAVQRALTYLGVTRNDEIEADGQSCYTLAVDLGEGRGICNATFDSASSIWRIEGSTSLGSTGPDAHSRLNDEHAEDSIEGCSPDAKPWNEKNLGRDWTDDLPVTDHVNLLKSRDWASTSLGPMTTWTDCLRTMTHKLLVDPRAANLFWGPDRICLYNEQFVEFVHDSHPELLGAPGARMTAENWPKLSKLMKEGEKTGRAFPSPDYEMTLSRSGDNILEECYFDGVCVPIRGKTDEVNGFYNSRYEITRVKMMERRAKLLHTISVMPDFQSITPWRHILKSCEPYVRDVSMLGLYSAVDEECARIKTCALTFEGGLGIQVGEGGFESTCDLYGSDTPLMRALRTARSTKSPVILGCERPHPLVEGIQWRAWNEASTIVVVSPIIAFGMIAGFLIFGCNPRRPYDEDHVRFGEDLCQVATTVLCGSISCDEARAREVELMRQVSSSQRFTAKLADVATVGMYSLSHEGYLAWANPRYYEIVGVPSSVEAGTYEFTLAHVCDSGEALRLFSECKNDQKSVTNELRLKTKWLPPGSKAEEHVWILASATPDIDEQGRVGIVGCITDIKEIKWSEKLQTDAASAARESKRQHEAFIDNTSHEIRNPLSAMMQCSDGIGAFVERVRERSTTAEELEECLDSIVENAQTISLCAAFQKRIVDDMLTISKLESNMLAMTPTLVEPAEIVRASIQIIEAEIIAADINFDFIIENSYYGEHNAEWVHCDAGRLTQVLINLFTNAVKFTKPEAKREIKVTLGATQKVSKPPNWRWFPSAHCSSDTRKDVCTEDEVFLTFMVEDTGRGISEEEMGHLFHRFAQASPKTHVKYGGSGLGLYISRELTELQHGMMALSSVPGQGSSFFFYIRATRASASEIPRRGSHSTGIVKHVSNPSMGKPARKQRPRAKIATTGQEPAVGIWAQSPRMPPREGSLPDPTSPPTPPTPTAKVDALILLVEDNLINAAVLSKQLRRLSYKVHLSNHGGEALDYLKMTRFWSANKGQGDDLTVILLDWEMPEVDGIRCTREIRRWEREGLLTEHLHIILCSANARDEQIRVAKDAGVDDFLIKPFTCTQVQDKIREMKEEEDGGGK